MSDQSVKTSQEENLNSIEKYNGSFAQDELGVTQIPTETIRSIKSITDLAIYTYLCSCPKGWRVNAKNLASHFDCNKEKIYKSLESLIQQGFLTRTVTREKGKFARYHYQLHLRKKEKIDQIDQPFPEKPYTVKPYTENPDTYKTENVQNKEFIENPIVDFDKSTNYKDDELFMRFYSIYPCKQKPSAARKAFYKHKITEEFVSMLCEDVKNRIDQNWKNRPKDKIPFPATYLNNKEWEGEIIEPETSFKTKKRYKTMDDIMGSVL